MKWEGVDKYPGSPGHHIWRSKLPTGWIVRDHSGSVCFVMDPNHEWKLEGKTEVDVATKPCNTCIKQNPIDANFCNSCGIQFGEAVKRCPTCETEYPLSERFCPRDGTALRSPNTPSPKTVPMEPPTRIAPQPRK